ncbi:TetR/AcrR family transcriptional regulator [Acinetobacter sp. S40]|uniref:TetR/AcrR family transcriptional regulator n=1 Tax=unclassified Acinetobacter TaxID=196816 RepID=UPI00190B40D4|nr:MULTISPECIES: TetR/AcrR family transcriptional regulator [unclassified Acinetobacter]MBJ9986885.1 TetR/AcrR family transcriptional regulator [Acinetobacter sp. S40]MBK0065210.1 TetR/AcrR family transcriptional regulator [Acinetobacter sp. S55]MBK0068417.1 TetR/AcrR family transcriptional regulator [Acinetobacter sp. S54]
MRKQPQQQRAIYLVDTVLQATQLCIAEYGLMQLTTPKIAERSGISVGSIYQYFENKEQIVQELLLRKSENLGQALKQLVVAQEHLSIEEIIPLSIQFGFDMMKADQGFFIEVLKHWHDYNHSKAAQILEQHFFEVGLYVFNHFYRDWDFETLKHKSFVIINSTLFTMMRYVSNNDFLIEEQQLKNELSKMILAYLKG